MVIAVRSQEMLVINDLKNHKTPNISNTQRAFADNYATQSCIIAPLICHGRVVGVMNLVEY
jgi:GAF domain-containing protein